MKRFEKKAYGSVPKTVLSLMGLVVGLIAVMGLISYLGSTGHKPEKTAFHKMPAAPRILVEPPEAVAIDDNSPYAQDESLSLRRYTSYFYNEGMLTEEAGYDEQGVRTLLHTLEYDTAGNLIGEQTLNEGGGTQTRRYLYEYDDLDRVVHEKIYWDKKVVKDNYFRYTKEGCAGVSYSYFNEQIQGGISRYCADHTEFLEDKEGNMLCAFQMNSLAVESPNKVWKMQWQNRGEQLLNRVQYYRDGIGIGRSHTKDWYLDIPRADEEQFNVYMCVPGTAEKKLTLQLNYEWQNDSKAYVPLPTFYRARYEEDRLLQQINYVEGQLTYFSACSYDTQGRLQEAVEYNAEGESAEALFHRYEYPEEGREEQYSYAIQGQTFTHTFADGDTVCFTFYDDGALSGIETTDASENKSEAYAFYGSGKNGGKLQSMTEDAKTTEGEADILKELGKEAADYGFSAGEDLTGEE